MRIAWNKGKKLHYPVWNKGLVGKQTAWNKGKNGCQKKVPKMPLKM